MKEPYRTIWMLVAHLICFPVMWAAYLTFSMWILGWFRKEGKDE